MNSITKKNYDAILIMIDRLTKYSHIVFFKKKYIAEQFEYIILNKIIKYPELSKKIINDKNKLFIFNSWKTLISLLNIKFKFFTIYHSKIDDQTKRINQILKQYLRYYMNKTQNNWIELLFIIQLTFNFKISNTTKKTSFFANFEKKFNLFKRKLSHISTQLIMKKAKIFKKIHNNIVKMQQKFAIYQNKKRKTTFQLKKKNISVNKKFENEKNQQKIKLCENRFVFHQKTEKIN